MTGQLAERVVAGVTKRHAVELGRRDPEVRSVPDDLAVFEQQGLRRFVSDSKALRRRL